MSRVLPEMRSAFFLLFRKKPPKNAINLGYALDLHRVHWEVGQKLDRSRLGSISTPTRDAVLSRVRIKLSEVELAD